MARKGITRDKIYWLIEMHPGDGGSIFYYCAPGTWCNHADHATKFLTRDGATLEANAHVKVPDSTSKYMVVQHSWTS